MQTHEFCYWLHFIFNLKERVDIITDDDQFNINTILNADKQREALIKMAEDYIYLNPPDHQKWLNGVVSPSQTYGRTDKDMAKDENKESEIRGDEQEIVDQRRCGIRRMLTENITGMKRRRESSIIRFRRRLFSVQQNQRLPFEMQSI